ncbi:MULTISPECIES: MFS transporter [Caloramator]|uniref:Major Facilitator Superfamily protein n=1 Tax=Caloramator proteoclasticus DSM 10124 TaxID=1121262 RepID=A0A1M4UPD8_9CLOT|nr:MULTISPECIES: MFS transporter [Caloramator]SHE58544.1 Major Facilitator Superfamily protein [Caloramator proteoclasticus DSM 10124]
MEQKELKRFNLNSYAFIVSYIFMGLLSGIAFDVLVTFLQQVSLGTAQSFSAYMGYSTFLAAAILLLAPKVGYKALALAAPLMVILGLVAVAYVNVGLIFPVATLAILTGTTLYDVILPPYLTAYTTPENRNKIFSTAIWTNLAGMVVATYFGGSLIVNRFAARMNISKAEAQAISEAVDKMSPEMLNQYILAHKDVLLMFAIVALISLIPFLFVKQVESDYKETSKEKKGFDWSILTNKYVLIFLVYYALIRFGASLICPYFSVYLNKFVGIDRATTSKLISYSYFAGVIFTAICPYIVKRIGQVVALGGLALASIPFMMFIANGRAFGDKAAMVVGLALFFRFGLMNAANPIMNSLPMEFVSKELRPAYNSAIFVAGALTSILAGFFTKGFLFKTTSGYAVAYYITAAVYTTASILLLVTYTKKYNRSSEQKEEEKAA